MVTVVLDEMGESPPSLSVGAGVGPGWQDGASCHRTHC